MGLAALLNETTDCESGKDGGESPLMMAARCGFTPVVQLLLCFGVDFNAKDNREGMTALMFAGEPTVLLRLLSTHFVAVDAFRYC